MSGHKRVRPDAVMEGVSEGYWVTVTRPTGLYYLCAAPPAASGADIHRVVSSHHTATRLAQMLTASEGVEWVAVPATSVLA